MSDQSGSLLEAGATVTIGASRSKARVGSFLVGEGGNLFATVNFRSREPATVYCGDTVAGTIRPAVAMEANNGARSVNDALSVFEVSRHIRVARRKSRNDADAVAKPVDAIGRQVFLDERDGDASGRVVSIDAPMHLRDARGSEEVYAGAIEIAADENGAQFAGDGDGGLLVHSEDGKAVGILVARTDRTFVAAPIDAILVRHGMSLATETAIERHNSVIARPAPSPVRHHFRSMFPTQGIEAALKALDDTASGRLNDFRPGHPYNAPHKQAPYILWGMLEAALAEDPNAVARLIERDGLMGVRLNYVVGLDRILREGGLSRQEWILQLTHRKAWNHSHHEAVDLFDMNAPPMPERDVRHLVRGRAVSMNTILCVVSASRRVQGMQGRSRSKLMCYVEPAMFTAAKDTNALKADLADAKSRRQYQQIYDRVTAGNPEFLGQSPFTVIEELAQGRVVRYATAWVIQAATKLFGGRRLEWQSIYSHDPSKVRPAAIEDRREAARIAS